MTVFHEVIEISAKYIPTEIANIPIAIPKNLQSISTNCFCLLFH